MLFKTREEATNYIRSNPEDYLTKSKNGFYNCPACDSGNGSKGTGALRRGTKNPNYFSCFSCNKEGDIIDFIAYANDIPAGTAEAFNKAYEVYSIEIEQGASSVNEARTQQPAGPAQQPQEQPAKTTDYSSFYKACMANLGASNYLEQRGISKAVAERFYLGYKDIYFTGLEHKELALIIPLSKGSYTCRNTNKATEQEQRYQKKGEACLFNAKALATSKKPVFIVEGELDALSIIEAGAEAVALGSTSNLELLVNTLKKTKVQDSIILALDNDEAGADATSEFFAMMKQAKAYTKTFVINVAGEYKDANEAYLKNRKAFVELVQQAEASPLQVQYKQKRKSDKHCLAEFWEHIHDIDRNKIIPTGLKGLDDTLGGGLSAGLIGLGAISALGKTTFAVQIANNIAKAGNDVLIFSLEMSREELIAKTISRLTAENSMAMYKTMEHASTSRDVLTGWNYHSYSGKKQDLIWYSYKQYEEYADRIYTVEGEMDLSVQDIKNAVKEHIDATGNRPVVFVDYLQILGIDDEKNLTDKTKADKLVKQLRIIARTYNIPVIAISSFNRENYNNPVSMSAFKESGGIEYTADTLLGLQFSFMEPVGDEDTESKEYKKKIRRERKAVKADKKAGRPINIQAVVLKNRYAVEEPAKLLLISKYNLYIDAEAGAEAPKINKDLQEQSKGQGTIKAKDILEQYIQVNYLAPYNVQYVAYNRAIVTYEGNKVQNLEAVAGKGTMWNVRDINTCQILDSVDTASPLFHVLE